jgi:hypothetical protein
MIGIIAIASFFNGLLFLFQGWLGLRWRRTKTENELASMMDGTGRTSESRTGAGQVRLLILYPHRMLAIGATLLTVSLLAFIALLLRQS